MYLLFITLVFSLALGPDVKLLDAQEANATLTSMPMELSTESVTTLDPAGNNLTMETMRNEVLVHNHSPDKENHTTKAEEMEQTTEEHTMMPTPEFQTNPEHSADPEQEKTTTNSITTEPPQTPSPSAAISDPPTTSAKPPVITPTPASNYIMPTTTPPITTPITTPAITTTITTPPIITIPNVAPPITTATTTTTTPITTPTITSTESTPSRDTSTVNQDSEKGPNWLIIAIIALVIFCILTTLCVMAIIIKRRRQSGKQSFGYMNGQRAKKKKGAEDDVWAGPVKLGGGDGEGPEEGDEPGVAKKADGVEVTELSTFVTVEENGGVGRPGSPEAKKWEEKEPLLYIDEQRKEKEKEAGKSGDAEAKEGAGKTDAKEAEPNGGETFCLTTAV
ncbi:mucin-2 [Pangasianodon hypophthalmus]|uniref:mucin-2 n=1 Tax=Pangasianodon hypophthalmus TaxID=310915 RepID=UPI0023074E2D|nr:mucin-2 [Pangasianodon hypophthalmus]